MERLKAMRRARGMSLTDVAEATGLLRTAIARVERDDVDPRISTVVAIARALRVPLCELIDEDAEHERHAKRRTRAKK